MEGNDLISLSDFRMVTIDSMDEIRQIYSRYPPLHSDYSLTTMLAWQHYMDYMYALKDGFILFLTRRNGRVTIRGPIGEYSDSDLKELLEFANEVGNDPPMGVLDQEMVKRLGMAIPGLSTVERREYFDYVYLASDLRDLPGKDYLKHRNQLNHFQKNRSFSIEPIGTGNMVETRDFYRKWCEIRRCEEEPILESEKQFISFCMDHYELLGLEGIVMRVDGEIEASSVFEGLRPDTAVTHIEKANPDIKGIYQAINQETASILSDRFRFINRESDMGVPGLRLAKERYRPHHMIEVHQIPREVLARKTTSQKS